ncbi:hypothetical protein [Niveispirillum sp. KHB5.9]|uniref:hypothetical protein n=1 Tax=Niveispirillum sp. KHB5.9 TaxID=3400269 RepID=UPI003A86FC30
MKISLGLSKVSIAAARETEILKNWPMSRQLEAMTEAAMGRPEKLAALREFIIQVKTRFPYRD